MSQPTSTPPVQPPHATTAAQVAGQSSSSSARTTELASLKVKLREALRQFPDFPSPGILFEDILPIFADPVLHESLLRCLELHILESNGGQKPDVIVGLEARGFLMGPSLALRMGAGFVPVRKQGKLPGPCDTQGYEKEYGTDFFQMQSDAIKPGQKVIVVDDIIATGGSAYAAGELINRKGGELMGFVFLLELEFLHGRDKLPAPVYTLLTGQETKA
ncbi:adenine phosphoribosyltransferase [Aspergillus tubingensis]|uniref:adenine phosphoribosyltransferase n=2 Tax=Aspergillus subgen. Circumdati TaxID=2720871 RepID=A0A8H3SR41_ASPTU|nr:adenine phosphoribosyltransferase 1 [Aspergillus costaricaensis CBS 115574]XP_035354740.1 adenine phosphoribosyltransferase 1 [Aspergillus tubingensis]RAK91015.1 adenine phosphoribosyltransferase 1 [Aspergillus costaricaensis CBS 115574]GFN13936.1 adenine phosphoribosyltransferase 1 [Aspergillus tubingensis]GLA77773.1 adenine phosphoribosyltransferase [Aspergillus tubingensis]GLA80852.1 adenine phosphoribosyltransferase [Aspergillus tubingensis]GLB23422.1 adenine phosphoribosyltransferase 